MSLRQCEALIIVLSPYWIVCFVPGSAPPVLEKCDLVTGVSSLSRLSLSSFYLQIGKTKQSLTLPFANQECHSKGRIHLVEKPLSVHQHHCVTWEDPAGHSSHRRSVSWLCLVFKWVFCHFTFADSNPFGSQAQPWLPGGGPRWRP